MQLLSTMLEEGDDVSQSLLDTILGAMVPPKREENAEAAAFARELIQVNQATLASHIQRLLACMMAGSTADTALECSYRTLLLEVRCLSSRKHGMQATRELGGAGDLSVRCLNFGTNNALCYLLTACCAPVRHKSAALCAEAGGTKAQLASSVMGHVCSRCTERPHMCCCR